MCDRHKKGSQDIIGIVYRKNYWQNTANHSRPNEYDKLPSNCRYESELLRETRDFVQFKFQ